MSTLPSYVSTSFGGESVVASPGVAIAVFMPQTIAAGNLIIAVCQEVGAVANNTYTVNAPWNVLTTVDDGSGLQRMTVAYAFVPANGVLAACTFTTTGTSGNTLFAQCFQYKNVKMTTPLGGSIATHAAHLGGTALSCGAISSTAPNSLAVAIGWTNLSTPGWPPAGWTNDYYPTLSNQIIAAHLPLVNSGDSTGAISSGNTAHTLFNIEVLGDGGLSFVGTDWFNGLPVTRR